ncbi:hypothetical protein EVG20_g8508 [Dentipellis fragilis]|uniref:F-box domain-containing protein n=1 Tax=Dentipellis fragilis TaxID=205917 RepID=A0A4Y9Y9N4_9AGAM|nr:hypothetical protein EVG20_g8508 [Dentipellis fragilis]
MLSHRWPLCLFAKQHRSRVQQSQDGSVLTKLPVQIILLILRGLDCRSLLRVSATCRWLRSLVDASPELQYIVVRAAEGLLEGPLDLLRASQHLQNLLDRRDRWRNMDMNKCQTIRLPNAPSLSLTNPARRTSFTNGAFVTTLHDQFRHIASVNVFLPPLHGSESHLININDFSLPPDAVLDDYLPFPLHGPVSDPVEQVLVYPGLDLLVLLKTSCSLTEDEFFYELHLRSLESAARRVHPRCSFAIIHASFKKAESSHERPFIRVMGDFIALHDFHDKGVRIVVWNWVTGDEIADIRDTLASHEVLYDLAFVAPDVIIAIVATAMFGPDTYIGTLGYATIRVYGFNPLVPREVGVRPLTLFFPTFATDISIWYSYCHSNQGQSSNWGCSVVPPVVAFSLGTASHTGKGCPPARTDVVVRCDVFALLLQRFAAPASRPPVVLSWEKWGPAWSRLLKPETDSTRYLGKIGGGRLPDPSEPPSRKKPLKLLDFCAGRYKPHELVRKPSTVRSYIFKHPVTTSLPYHVVLVHNIRRRSEFFISDDSVMTCYWVTPEGINDVNTILNFGVPIYVDVLENVGDCQWLAVVLSSQGRGEPTETLPVVWCIPLCTFQIKFAADPDDQVRVVHVQELDRLRAEVQVEARLLRLARWETCALHVRDKHISQGEDGDDRQIEEYLSQSDGQWSPGPANGSVGCICLEAAISVGYELLEKRVPTSTPISRSSSSRISQHSGLATGITTWRYGKLVVTGFVKIPGFSSVVGSVTSSQSLEALMLKSMTSVKMAVPEGPDGPEGFFQDRQGLQDSQVDRLRTIIIF